MELPMAVLHSWKENKHFVCEAFEFVPCMLGTAWAQMCLKFLLSQLLICTFWAFMSAKQIPGRVLDMITVFIRETGIMQWMICETWKNKWFVPFQLCASRCHEMLLRAQALLPEHSLSFHFHLVHRGWHFLWPYPGWALLGDIWRGTGRKAGWWLGFLGCETGTQRWKGAGSSWMHCTGGMKRRITHFLSDGSIGSKCSVSSNLNCLL